MNGRVMVLKTFTNSMAITLTFGSSHWRWRWLPWIFGTLWTYPRKLHLPSIIPEWRKIQKTCQKGNVYHCAYMTNNQLVHIRSYKRTSGGMKNLLQHPQDEEFVQHFFFHPLQVFYMQYVKRWWFHRPHQ